MFIWIWVFLLYSWKVETFFSKIERSKVTDYAALKYLLVLLKIIIDS